MKFLLSFLVFILGFAAQAMTNGQFVGPYGVIRVLSHDYAGNQDTDGKVLYDAMDVPEKNSMIGPGKAIETKDGALQFICANRGQQGFECAIFIHQKGYGSVNAAKKTMVYKVLGEEADVYGKLFKVDGSGEFHFVSVDGLLKVAISRGHFEVSFQQLSLNSEQGLVIVNVEDTLKISHIQNFWDSLNYNTDSKKRYLGMAQLLQILARSNPSYRFVYLTRPPELVAGKTEREFVLNNKFPRGEFRTYSYDNTIQSRINVLTDILSSYAVNNVILISHNGSPDPVVFKNVTRDFSNINFTQYLHIVYSTSAVTELGFVLYPEQTGYVTSAELAIDLQLRGFVKPMEIDKFVRTMVHRVVGENPEARKMEELAIPTFMNCDDFQWRWSVDGDYKFLAPLREHLINRCHMQAPLAGF